MEKIVRLRLTVLTLGLVATGCSQDPDIKALPLGQFTPGSVQAADVFRPTPEYRIDAQDVVSVTVFQEPDLSVKETTISTTGDVAMPLLGQVHAAGMTTQDLALKIQRLLDARYTRNARVTVEMVKAVNRTVTVTGEVKKPGLYSIPSNRFTLMQAIALGEGGSEVARLSEVVVLREVDGRRYLAKFDIDEIRAGRAIDPPIYQSDVVVVGVSRFSQLYRSIVPVLPAMAGIFVALKQ